MLLSGGPFLQGNEDVGLHLRPKLLNFFNPQTTSKLCVEIATVHWGKPFLKACYTVEGYGPSSLEWFEINDVNAAVAVDNIPNVRNVAKILTTQPLQHLHHEQ